MEANELIAEVESLEVIEELEDAYARHFGIEPFNVSHWDLSADVERSLLQILELPALFSIAKYTYSYSVEQRAEVLRKLGADPAHSGCLFTPCGTLSLLSAVNWLKARSVQQLVVACPVYFAAPHACRRFGIEVIYAPLEKSRGTFELPRVDNLAIRGPRALLVTSPAYCTGVYLDQIGIASLRELLQAGWIVIADECFALPGRELCRELGQYPNFLGIYSPHKGAGINGIKFSALICAPEHQRFFEQWADVFFGGLGCDTLLAMRHYLSANFDLCISHFVERVSLERAFFDDLTRQASVETDRRGEGHFVMCYFPHVPARYGDSRLFLSGLVETTGGSLMPGNRSRFHARLGFCFRVNLARSGARFRPTLLRLVEYLNSPECKADCFSSP